MDAQEKSDLLVKVESYTVKNKQYKMGEVSYEDLWIELDELEEELTSKFHYLFNEDQLSLSIDEIARDNQLVGASNSDDAPEHLLTWYHYLKDLDNRILSGELYFIHHSHMPILGDVYTSYVYFAPKAIYDEWQRRLDIAYEDEATEHASPEALILADFIRNYGIELIILWSGPI